MACSCASYITNSRPRLYVNFIFAAKSAHYTSQPVEQKVSNKQRREENDAT